MFFKQGFCAACAVGAVMSSACASGAMDGRHGSHHSSHHSPMAKHHGPIGVMGDHMPHKGKVMMSFRYQRMRMEGSRIGADAVSPETIATTVPNRFFGAPGQPPTLRVVPTEMSMDMYMVGAMVGVTDWLTVMAMGMLVEKEMDHVTFQGPAGTTVLGGFETGTSGFGDTKVAGLVRLLKTEAGNVRHNAHLNLGLSLPTGSIVETDQILTPTGAMPSPRLPYPMQLGSGTVDFEPGATYTGASPAFSWGAQYRATIRSGDNDEGYALGDAHQATAWAQYGPKNWIAFSLRGLWRTQDAIDGIDPAIMAPVQTANPDFQGGDRFDIGVGLKLVGQKGAIRGHGLGVEMLFPVYQDLNGPQLETDWTLTLGWRKAF